MRSHGYLVLAKRNTDRTTEDPDTVQPAQSPTGRRLRSYPLLSVSHQLRTGPCIHCIAADGGRVVESDLDERLTPRSPDPDPQIKVELVFRWTACRDGNLSHRNPETKADEGRRRWRVARYRGRKSREHPTT
jgi:hypothetical protein